METTSLHRLLNNIKIKDQWLMFIYPKIPQQFKSTLTVCSAHFSSDCIVNQAQFNAGFSKKLLIKDAADPTLLGPTSNSQPVNKLLTHLIMEPAYWSMYF